LPAKAGGDTVRILSWNVNGIRACAKKGLAKWLTRSRAEIVGLQEVRALPDQVPEELLKLKNWQLAMSPAQRKGYSGVALFSRRTPDRIDTDLGEDRFDIEGRVQIARYGRLAVANVYFPNGNGKDRDNSRVPYKLDFYRLLFDRLQGLRKSGARVIVMGDFNTAHKEIDLARPKTNRKTSGFLPEECEELDRWLKAGWVDTFRHFDPSPDHYTWWSQRFNVRAKNIGWRIDYVLASPAAMKFVKSASIRTNDQGSDHCPIGVEVDPAIFS
jgi:exodeoxyribonuclease-3